MKHFLRIILLLLLFIGPALRSMAQIPNDLSNIRVEELTDEQVKRFAQEADRLHLNDAQIEQLALSLGMSPVEVVRLKDRIKSYRSATKNEGPATSQRSRTERGSDSLVANQQFGIYGSLSAFAPLSSPVFGSETFSNPKITFEPNLRLPTPPDYQLAPDDELLIHVSGYSEANYNLKISPEGQIRIPQAGPVTVSGMTIEQARRTISQKLSNTLYTNIKTGKTKLEVFLGNTRSIKVNIIGEATVPGTYTLPSLASVYNALYACGGPNKNGSFRDIELIRDNKTIARIDVYRFLAEGNRNADARLQDQDIIRINTYRTRIEIKGEVKKPGIFDVMADETLESMLKYAGGYTDYAYTDKIQVYSNTTKERKVSTIKGSDAASHKPGKGDAYVVGRILSRFSNRVSIRGSVFRPGEFEMKEGMTLSMLILEADGLREDAFTQRANIHRLKADLSPEIVAVDLEKLLNKEIPDYPLRREDRVFIFSKFDLKEGRYVSIDGEVAQPGNYLYEEGITVQDLILMAGGLKESATTKRVEISRRIRNTDSLYPAGVPTAEIIQLDIRADSFAPFDSSHVLRPFDEVSIHPAPGYYTQKNVVIEGEVPFAGKYTLKGKTDRISDLVKRAGGVTREAYVKGAVLFRSRTISRTEQANIEQGLRNLAKQNAQSGRSAAAIQSDIDAMINKSSDVVGINLERILDDPGSEYDLFLNDGDTLRIPRQLQTVRVNGEVLYPALVRFDKKSSLKDYISGSGGYTDRAARKRVYVVNANGSAEATHSFLFFKNYPRVLPGAEIYVPTKREKERLRPIETVTIITSLVTMIAILFNTLK